MIATSHSKAGGAATAVRCLRPVLRWGEENGYAREELAWIKPPAKVQRRKRCLATNWSANAHAPAIQEAACSADAVPALHAGTSREAASARWGEVDLQKCTWTIPFTKNGEPHVVPLSRQAADLLLAIRPHDAHNDDLVFRARARGGNPGGKLSDWDRETQSCRRPAQPVAGTGTTCDAQAQLCWARPACYGYH